MEIIRLMFLELAQNMPLLAGFAIAFQFWQQEDWAVAIGCMVAGSVVGALAIRITEPKMVKGHRETTRALIGNAATFAGLMVLLAIYLSAGWSRWWTDIAAGTLAALVLAVAQEMASEERLGLARSLWLGLSCSVGLILLRYLMAFSAPMAAVIVAVWVTLVMGTSYLKDLGEESVYQASGEE